MKKNPRIIFPYTPDGGPDESLRPPAPTPIKMDEYQSKLLQKFCLFVYFSLFFYSFVLIICLFYFLFYFTFLSLILWRIIRVTVGIYLFIYSIFCPVIHVFFSCLFLNFYKALLSSVCIYGKTAGIFD